MPLSYSYFFLIFSEKNIPLCPQQVFSPLSSRKTLFLPESFLTSWRPPGIASRISMCSILDRGVPRLTFYFRLVSTELTARSIKNLRGWCLADGLKARARTLSKLKTFTDLFIIKPKIIRIANLFQPRHFCFCSGIVCVIIRSAGQVVTLGLPMKDLIENLALNHSNYCL